MSRNTIRVALRHRRQEALAMRECDLDTRRGSLLVRNGKGSRRREHRHGRLGLGATAAPACLTR
jgi:hypothetical protein